MIGEILLKHLTCIGDLSPGDEEGVRQLTGEIRMLPRGQDILQTGDRPDFAIVVLGGYLSRHSWNSRGSRQIHSFYIGSDAPSLETIHLDYMDHSLGAVAPSKLALVPHRVLHRLMDECPNVLSLLWRETLIQAAVFREWLIRNSYLPAHQAMAHLFCETYTRARAARQLEGNSCAMPVTQEILSEALGLTPVHVNRTLQLLRGMNLVDLRIGRLFVHDFDELALLGEFDPQYLHLRPGCGGR